LETKKQEIGKLQKLMEDLQNKVSELTAAQTSRERELAKELERLRTMLTRREREIQRIRQGLALHAYSNLFAYRLTKKRENYLIKNGSIWCILFRLHIFNLYRVFHLECNSNYNGICKLW
jgi:hypothetical protein